MTVPVADLLNLGPKSASRLEAVGIHTLDDLERVGSVEAFRLLRESFPGTSLNFLYAMEGALLDIRWDQLPPDVLAQLRSAAGALPRAD